MTVGDRIRTSREKKGFTRKALAELLKIDQSQYGKFETNKLNPTVPQVIELCSILEQSIDYILTGKKLNEVDLLSQGQDYKHSYEMALKNIDLQSEIIRLKDRINELEKGQIKSKYDIGSKDQPYSNVAESKSKLK